MTEQILATGAIGHDDRAPVTILSTPPSLQSFGMAPGTGPAQWADYLRHPAYASVAGGSVGARLASLAIFLRSFALILCKRLISYELIPAHVRAGGGLEFCSAALRNIFRHWVGGKPPAWGHHAAVAQTLQAQGVCVAAVDGNSFAAINAAAKPLLERLRARRGARSSGGRDFIESRDSALRTSNIDLFGAVEEMLEKDGLLAAISVYLCRPARLIDVSPQINDSSDDFWLNTFSDLPEANRPARYFHKDASGGDIKAILYMSDVGPKNGPFSYAIGSHAVRSPTLISWIEEANDQSGFSSTDHKARLNFSRLPKVLQRKCAVGNDLMPDDPATAALLHAEWVITAPHGHLVVFDTKGFHRGGMVAEGERIVLTCVIG